MYCSYLNVLSTHFVWRRTEFDTTTEYPKYCQEKPWDQSKEKPLSTSRSLNLPQFLSSMCCSSKFSSGRPSSVFPIEHHLYVNSLQFLPLLCVCFSPSLTKSMLQFQSEILIFLTPCPMKAHLNLPNPFLFFFFCQKPILADVLSVSPTTMSTQ